jgi:hypothetical protein
MVRRAKGPDGQQWTIRGELGSHAVDTSGFNRFIGFHERKNSRQTFGQHRFARTWRTHHENVVPARSGNFQRALGMILSSDITVVFVVRRRVGEPFRPVGVMRFERTLTPKECDRFR